MSYFPPKSVYPNNYDDDSTLFLVFDSSETTTTEENQAWAEDISIKPVDAAKPEQWAENGYANINGELFYYAKVGKDSNGKINKLKKCLRNLGGDKTKYNPINSEVRGYVVAEHHHQLVDAIIKIEKFVGENFSEDQATLDWRIRHLQSIPAIFDDFSCPDVTFDVITLESNPETGTIIQYEITIDGEYSSFKLDFGDGDFTTTTTSGTKRYAPNSKIDPAISVTNTRCTIIQTPIIREESAEPQITPDQEPFSIKIPTLPDIPNVVFPNIPTPSIPFNLPPIVLPCVEGGPTNINIGDIPSVITITPVDIPSLITIAPSVITITPIEIPSVITFVDSPEIPSVVVFIDAPEIPSIINFGTFPTIPTISIGAFPAAPVISIGGFPAPPTIEFGSMPSFPSIEFGAPPDISIEFGSPPALNIDYGSSPEITVNWGSVPTLECVVTLTCPGGGGGGFAAQSFEENFKDTIEPLTVDIGNNFNIPSEINLIVPKIPDVKVIHDIPTAIEIISPKIPLPERISIVAESNIPSVIEIKGYDIPKTIILDASNLPKSIPIEVPDNFPKSIKIDASDIPSVMHVIGIPQTIEIKGIPEYLELKMPENPEVELVYKGSPIPLDVKVHLDISSIASDELKKNCVAIVPCTP